MLEWIISSSILIAVVMLLRRLLKGRIDLRLQYALWGLVLVRLLLPVSLGSSSLSVMNQVERSRTYQEAVQPESNKPETEHFGYIVGENADFPVLDAETPVVVIPNSGAVMENTGNTGQNQAMVPELPPQQEVLDAASGNRFELKTALPIVWFGGSVLLGVWFALTNLFFGARLRKSRIAVDTAQKLPVYVSRVVDTPCLFGCFCPAVYLTEKVMADERVTRHAVEHELTHYRHRDHIWAVLRCVCLVIHWYNPLVWWAAVLSQKDAELACDESTILRLGEGERAEYGRTLLRLTCEKRTVLLHTATTMTGSGKSIRERISLIVNRPKMAVYTLVAVVIIAAIAVGCTFTGAVEHTDDANESINSVEDRENGVEENITPENSGDTIPDADIKVDVVPQKTEIDPAAVCRRLAVLTTGDITATGDAEVDASKLAALIRDVMGNRTDRTEAFTPFWSVEVALSDGASLTLQTGLPDYMFQKDDVQIIYEDGQGRSCTLFAESEALRQYIRVHSADGFVDEDAAARYADQLEQIAVRYADRTFFPEYRAYDLIQFQHIDYFEWDGTEFEVYLWEPAFYTDTLDQVELTDGTWIDAQQRVRGAAGYVILFHDGDTLTWMYLLWELYEGADENTRRENAHTTIVHYLNRTDRLPRPFYSRISNGFLYQSEGESVIALGGGELVTVPLTEAQATINHNGWEFTAEYRWAKYGNALAVISSPSGDYSISPLIGSDRYLQLVLDMGYTYLIDTTTGEVHDPLSALDNEITERIGALNFSADGQYAVISHHSGTECILLNCATGEVTQLPYASDVYSVSGHFLDETHILLTSAFEVGAPHKTLYSLARYDITTGELTELPGQYTAKDKSASNFLAMCEGGAAAYTYEDGYLVIIDLITWEKTVTRFMERGVNDIFYCPGVLVGVKYETVVYLLDYDGNARGICA